jgi:hypothetical protein
MRAIAPASARFLDVADRDVEAALSIEQSADGPPADGQFDEVLKIADAHPITGHGGAVQADGQLGLLAFLFDGRVGCAGYCPDNRQSPRGQFS